MTHTEIIEDLIGKLSMPGGRHLYGILSTYDRLEKFSNTLRETRFPDGRSCAAPLSVNLGILTTIPDDEFQELVRNEAKRPEPTAAHIQKAFESFLRSNLKGKGLITLADLELVFAYNLELNMLRTLAIDADRVLLLLPGRRSGNSILMYPDWEGGNYRLPTNLIADNHLWELKE